MTGNASAKPPQRPIFIETKKPSCILISTSWHCCPRATRTLHKGADNRSKTGFQNTQANRNAAVKAAME